MTRPDRPNVVLVMTDQQRFDTIAELGATHVDTPNLDRLAREGTSFTRTYVTAPSCAPSRASLFTGLYPRATGVLRNDEPWSFSWVELLAEAGYRCVNVGKMHTNPFEKSFGFHERHVVENKDRAHPGLPFFLDQWDKALWTRGVEKPTRVTYRRRADYTERLGAFEWEPPEDLHPDAFVGSLARMWLDQYTGQARYTGEEPFFLQVGFPGPHPPYDPTPRHLDPYRDRDVPLPRRTPEDLTAQPTPLQVLREHHQANDHDAIVHLAEPTEEQSRRRRRHYYANVSLIDEQVGLLVDALEERGVLDDTVIIFTSDHGDCLGDHGQSQKWTMYEPSVHVPLLIWGPDRVAGSQRVDGGRTIDGLTSLMDVGPTVLELAGIEPPGWMDAESLAPALRGEPWAGREQVFSEHARDGVLAGTDLMTMVCDGRWKLVEFIDSDEGQLFDLAADPYEETDRWVDPAYAEEKARLRAQVRAWRAAGSLQRPRCSVR